MTQPIYTKEILSGVPETDARILRMDKLEKGNVNALSFPIEDSQEVPLASKPYEVHPEPTPIVPQTLAGNSATAEGHARRAVDEAYEAA